MTEEEITRALAYPDLDPADFAGPCLFSAAAACAPVSNFAVKPDETLELADALIPVPSWRISFTGPSGENLTWRKRIAVLGIGSNSSAKVLRRKLGACDLCVIPGRIADHVAAHGAFLGKNASTPATLHDVPGAVTAVTVGFYDQDDFFKMKATEPNYDALLLRRSVTLPDGTPIRVLAWVAVWGALAKNNLPLPLSEISAQTQLEKFSNAQARAYVMALTGAAGDDRRFVYENFENRTLRRARTAILQKTAALPPNVQGDMVYAAPVRRQADMAALLQA
jgi:hypothetical protein